MGTWHEEIVVVDQIISKISIDIDIFIKNS